MGSPRGQNPGPSRRPRAIPTLLIKDREVPLGEGETLIGRGGDVRISILGSLVSRHHAKLVSSDGRVTVADLGSRNGVFVNGVRLDAPALLEDGDTLLIGTTQLTFFLGNPEEGQDTQARAIFDDQGNLVPESALLDAPATRTLLQIEPEDTLDLDREDVTIQGTRPPPPRASSALLQKQPKETDPPPTPRVRDPVAPVSGPLAKLSLGRVKPTPAPPSRPSAPPRVGPARSTPPPATVLASRPLSSPSQAAVDPLLAALGVIDRMLGRGDADAASRALTGHLQKRIATARTGTPLPREVIDGASLRCLALLELSGDPSWFDTVLELHLAARTPMTHAVIDRLSPFVGVVPGPSQDRLAEYQLLIRELLGDVDVDSLDACERVLTLGT